MPESTPILPPPPHTTPPPRPRERKRSLLPLWLLIGVLVVLAAIGIVMRMHDESKLKKTTDAGAVPLVTVMEVKPAAETEDVILPGNVEAWHDAVIYARTSGYLKEWLVDIGTQVKAGQLLAVIEAPDVDAQTRQAAADLVNAKANNDIAQLTAKRWQALVKTDSVSQQDADNKKATADAAAATVQADIANLAHYQQLTDFEQVKAPYDGVITARYTDTGALINAGNASGQQLFAIAETDKLRVYVQVPETYAGFVTPELTAEVYFAEHPNQPFHAVYANSAEAIDPVARTLTIQLEMDNKEDLLLAGSYATVHLKIPGNPNHVKLPANTLLFRAAGLQAAVVGDDGKAHLQNLTVARDLGKSVEVGSGIDPGQKIIINPPDSLVEGEQVKVVTPDALKQKEQAKEQEPGSQDNAPAKAEKKKLDPLKDN